MAGKGILGNQRRFDQPIFVNVFVDLRLRGYGAGSTMLGVFSIGKG